MQHSLPIFVIIWFVMSPAEKLYVRAQKHLRARLQKSTRGAAHTGFPKISGARPQDVDPDQEHVSRKREQEFYRTRDSPCLIKKCV